MHVLKTRIVILVAIQLACILQLITAAPSPSRDATSMPVERQLVDGCTCHKSGIWCGSHANINPKNGPIRGSTCDHDTSYQCLDKSGDAGIYKVCGKGMCELSGLILGSTDKCEV